MCAQLMTREHVPFHDTIVKICLHWSALSHSRVSDVMVVVSCTKEQTCELSTASLSGRPAPTENYLEFEFCQSLLVRRSAGARGHYWMGQVGVHVLHCYCGHSLAPRKDSCITVQSLATRSTAHSRVHWTRKKLAFELAHCCSLAMPRCLPPHRLFYQTDDLFRAERAQPKSKVKE